MRMRLDHLVVVAPSLESGLAHVQDRLGVFVPAGGAHPRMGTHNRLMRLGDGVYFEIISVDPDGAPPNRPRWYGLDSAGGGPVRLATWAIGTTDLDAALASAPPVAGRAEHMTRDALEWRIAIPEDGGPPMGGAFPTLIEWPGGRSPAASLPDLGCTLSNLTIEHPDPDPIAAFLAGRLNDSRIEILAGPKPRLRAEIMTPGGVRRLE